MLGASTSDVRTVPRDHRAATRKWAILGYMTLALCEVMPEKLPAKLAKRYAHRVYGVKLARLAVSRARQREGLGQLMMLHHDRVPEILPHLRDLFEDTRQMIEKSHRS